MKIYDCHTLPDNTIIDVQGEDTKLSQLSVWY